jgi:hypothetical protein
MKIDCVTNSHRPGNPQVACLSPSCLLKDSLFQCEAIGKFRPAPNLSEYFMNR